MKDTVSKIKFAICGCGHIGKRHAITIQADPNAELTALIDSDISKIKEQDFFSYLPTYQHLQDYLATYPEVDVVIIATPNAFHIPQAIQVLEAGYHVIIEKPMGLSALECQKVVELSEKKNRQVFVVKQNRYSPPVQWLKRIVEEEKLGKIFQVQINCFWNRDERYYGKGGHGKTIDLKTPEDIMAWRMQSGLHPWKGSVQLDGGVLYTQFSHFIDIMYWVFGNIQNISTRLHNFSHQNNTDFCDSGYSIFDFKNGGMGSLQFSTAIWAKNMESSITVIGENGSLKIGGQYMNSIDYCHIKDVPIPELPPTNPPNDYAGFSGSAANHGWLIANVIQVLNGKQQATTSAREGRDVVDIIERIYQASENLEKN